MSEKKQIVPFSLKDAPALIEKVFPAQKMSIESYKEQMGGNAKTLTVLGSYWKGRKPLILNKSCILGCLLPATDNVKKDLEIYEMLLALDKQSFAVRIGRIKPSLIVERVEMSNITDYFNVAPLNSLPLKSPFKIDDFKTPDNNIPKLTWRDDIDDNQRRKLESEALPQLTYRKLVDKCARPETCGDDIYNHIWNDVNSHLGTNATSIPELVEQLGIMRFGHRPRVADTFTGSGQIPFEAARLGCDVYASDLNPISCMLTWGALNIVGCSTDSRNKLQAEQNKIAIDVISEINKLEIESDGNGWNTKAFLYCLEVKCPQSGWMVPLLPTQVISKGRMIIVQLTPNHTTKTYNIIVTHNVSHKEMIEAEKGTIRSDGKGQAPYLVHSVNGVEYRTKISTLRGDFRNENGSNSNRIRLWEKTEFMPTRDDIFQERLYAIQWVRKKNNSKREEYDFRSVTEEDIKKEKVVEKYLSENIQEWQEKGWIPEMRIEAGDKTDELIRTRGWTYWHQLFSPRHLLLLGLLNKHSTESSTKVLFTGVLDYSSKLCRWTTSGIRIAKDGSGKQVGGASDGPSNVFYNQALNTMYNYGCRASQPLLDVFLKKITNYPINTTVNVKNLPANLVDVDNDIYVTDPPYGDAVKYEEILEYFIAWNRKNSPPEFANWTWDSRRALAIKGEDESFRRGMVAAYKRMAEKMPDNGIQVIMFTHQSGSIWADMANIVWASGLQVTAAWYVVTETDSALREGSYVKGTILLVLRKRLGAHKTNRSDLAWEIQEEVEEQVSTLTGLNQEAKDLYRDENLFSDADVQMAGYAAALRVLTRYSIIDGKDMAIEAVRPRVKGQITFVDELIEFAVGVANQALVPPGIDKSHWDKLQPAERFYLKMLELESIGAKTIDNYQNFAKAFKVKNFKPLMASEKANSARLKSSVEFARSEMSGESEMANTVLRGVLYGIMELAKDTDGDEMLTHISYNVPDYLKNREVVVELSDYLAGKLEGIRPDEASSARILRDLARNQKWGG